MSNPAESVSVLVECFKLVGFQEDGMRTLDTSLAPYGIEYDSGNTSGNAYSSDGDIGIVVTGTGAVGAGVRYKKTCTFGVFDTSTFDVVTVRGRVMSPNARWNAEAYNTAGTKIGSLSWLDNSTFETHSFPLLTYNTINRITFGCITTDGASATCAFDYCVLSQTYPVTLTPSNLTVENVLTEGFDTAELKCSYPDDASKVPDVNDHVKIWLSKGSTVDFHKVFTGVIDTVRKISKGKEHRWIEGDASGYGKYLTQMRKRVNKANCNASSLILYTVQDLVDAGLITAYGIQLASETITVKTDASEEFIDDILRSKIFSIEEDNATSGKGLDWDFYVDYGSNLHCFQKGIFSSTVNLANEMFSFEYEKTRDRIINRAVIRGAMEKVYGDGGIDGPWTEYQGYPGNPPYWEFNTGAFFILHADAKQGNYSILNKTSTVTVTPIWSSCSFNPIDVSQGGMLYFQARYVAALQDPREWRGFKHYYPELVKTGSLPNSVDFNIYCYSSPSDYFVIKQTKGGGNITREEPGPIVWFEMDWSAFQIELGIKSMDEWAESGNPDWSKISKVKIEAAYPVPLVGKSAYLYVDAFSIAVNYYGIWEDLASQASFGVREYGVTYPRNNLKSDAECSIAASLIVEAYKSPLESVKNLKVSDNFGLTLGTEYVFNTLDIDTMLRVSRIRHELDNFELSTEVDLTERYIPTPEVMLATFQRQIDACNRDIELWKKMAFSRATSPGKGVFWDWWDMDPAIGVFAWTGSNNFLIQGAEQDALVVVEAGPYGGECSIDVGKVWLRANATDGAPDVIQLRTGPTSGAHKCLSPLDTIAVGSIFSIDKTLNVQAKVAVGDYDMNYSGFGFFLNNNTLYGQCWNSSGQSSSIQIGEVLPNVYYVLEGHYYPNERIDFFIDRAWKGSLDSNLPNASMSPFYVYVLTSNNEHKELVLQKFQSGVFK